jgi:hypothetical protein
MNDDEVLARGAYAFDLHLVCGGRAYFTVFTMQTSDGDHGREVREPSPVDRDAFAKVLLDVRQPCLVVEDDTDIEYWIRKRGWALVSLSEARDLLPTPQWLDAHECIKDPVGTYTDVALVARRVSDGEFRRESESGY